MKIEILPPLLRPDLTPQETKSREIIPVGPTQPLVIDGERVDVQVATPEPSGPPTALQKLVGNRDVRDLSPRQMVDLSLDLYAGNIISWDEYTLLAFQPDLHPDYDATVGALTGRPAAPDTPRDYVAQWEEKLDFEMKHNTDDRATLDKVAHIVTVLRQIENPTNLSI
ncbi:hypothetical protein [Magnetospira sp. QH-2]|uniref:hypothetical protein n=1 Tax=Magnetospira sp. (strain QH-2) TaxID=1288970 RepID=UPI0003E80B2E|nr:hypothetical protein [Magnetospira sp. QH-2]CCQ74158.1 Protein of unknown function [Magnetospira sp. QH-2]